LRIWKNLVLKISRVGLFFSTGRWILPYITLLKPTDWQQIKEQAELPRLQNMVRIGVIIRSLTTSLDDFPHTGVRLCIKRGIPEIPAVCDFNFRCQPS